MKILNSFYFTGSKNFFFLKQSKQENVYDELSENSCKNYSNAITALNRSLVTFKAKRKPPIDKQMLLNLLDQGKSEEEIATILGETTNTIHSTLLKYGAIKTNYGYVKNNEIEISRLLSSGKSIKETARIIGCSEASVGYIKTKFGIRSRTRIERDRDLITRMYREGLTQDEIARTIKCGQATVSHALKRWGVETRSTISENYKDIVVEMYNNGATQREIARVLNCSISTVKKILSEADVELRQKTSINDVKDLIIKLYREGKSLKDISRETGYSQPGIHANLKEWGLIKTSSSSQKGITESNKEKIIEMYKQGCTYKQIADTIGCALSTIHHALIRWGFVAENVFASRNNLMEQNKDLILCLLDEGRSIQKIADTINCDRSTISHALKKWGIETRGTKMENNKDLIIEMYREGTPVSKIANIMNCSYNGIVMALKRWGIK